jgi:hypothetical protein
VFCELEDFYWIVNLRQEETRATDAWTRRATSPDQAWLLTSEATTVTEAVSTIVLAPFATYWNRISRSQTDGMHP